MQVERRYEVHRVWLDRDGYDRVGNYYGSGLPVFVVYENGGLRDLHVRARSFKEAAELAAQKWGRQLAEDVARGAVNNA